MSARKVMCAVDFSAGSVRAMQVAIRVANERDAELVLVHAWSIPAIVFSELAYPEAMVQSLRDEAMRRLEETSRDARAAGARNLTTKLVDGAAWVAISHEAQNPSYELVVIGTHGRTGIGRVLLGSVAETVIRHCPCSVLVVRPDSSLDTFSHVLCPVDFSASSRAAMFEAGKLAKAGGRGVTLLHSIELPVGWGGEVPSLDFTRQLDAEAMTMLDRWAAELSRAADVPVAVRVRLGRPGAQILEVVHDDPSIDLVVVGSHGYTGLRRLVLGSVAEKVARHSRPPVLVVRSQVAGGAVAQLA